MCRCLLSGRISEKNVSSYLWLIATISRPIQTQSREVITLYLAALCRKKLDYHGVQLVCGYLTKGQQDTTIIDNRNTRYQYPGNGSTTWNDVSSLISVFSFFLYEVQYYMTLTDSRKIVSRFSIILVPEHRGLVVSVFLHILEGPCSV